MKNLIYLFLTALIVACSGDNPSDSNTSNNNVSYFFEIEFGGETHRVEGSTSTSYPLGGGAGNNCVAYTIDQIILGINDPTADNYVSGNYINIGLTLDGPFLGDDNVGSLSLSGVFLDDYLESLGALPGFNNSSNPTNPLLGLNEISGINLTDLGTAGLSWANENCDAQPGSHCFGESVKGSYSNILYFSSDFLNYDIPVPISIEFSAPRYL